MMPAEVFRREVYARSVVPAKVLFQRLKWISAFERVKKSATRLKSGPQRRPARDSSIPASRETLRNLAEGCNFDFFTRSFAGMTPVRQRYVQQFIDGACPAFRPPYSSSM